MNSVTQNQGYLYTFSKSSFGLGEVNPVQSNAKKGIILTLIADDHPYLLHGVESDLNKDPKIKIVGTAGSYDELLERTILLQPNVVLMDLRMPGYEKYELKNYIAKLKKSGNCKVIVFSNETGWARIHRCLDMGAQAYIEKAISMGRLPEFIHRVYEDQEILIFTAEKLPQIQFSPRQREILHYIADGKENDQIAAVLNIEVKTVQSYVNEVKAKLGEAFNIHPIRPRVLLLLASKLGFRSTIL
jgi:DNA-binding NarL/FixJ family response regulator